jgi:hypothetical protein
MATLVLQTAGAAAGALFGPVGAAVGRAVGGLAGAVVDRALIPGARSGGPRLDSLDVQTSTEGAPVPRVYGRVRIAGQVIWATRLEEETREEGGGGKGLGGGQRTYRYFANFAVGLCEGKVDRIGRVWADGKPLDLSGVTMRRHLGGEFQEPDPLIEAKQGDAPAYRGLAYVVFERLPLDPYGNRLPQLSFEVIRCVDALEGMVQAVTLIPGATEFGYATEVVTREGAPGVTVADNRHVGTAASDFEASVDELADLCPALERVALVVSWFADDLRAAHCRPRPKIEDADRRTRGATWEVDGVTRTEAAETSRLEGRPAYGGTPSDDSVVAAIRSLRARGLKVTFYPFLLMDVPPGNGLPDPYGGDDQPAFPWRGRITVHPAPGRPGSPDGSGAAADEIAGFVGAATAADFDVDGDRVRYTGPAEWSLRRMILHYAHLCAAAGGVDAFLIGSELIGLTTVRSGRQTFPFVEALRDLAADVSAVLGSGTLVSYAADWSEFFGYRPDDGSGDHLFHLDRLWTSPDVDFVGIDVYWPLADWRDGEHLDAATARSTYDPSYLGGNVAGGEGFDWFYPTAEARRTQAREPITDGMHGKPWVFRYKDLHGWWSHRHYHRLDGVEVEEPTGWQPQEKPFWFTEVGCPAVDAGANQPNVFVDPKSSESNLPHFSDGGRDDAVQRRYLEAVLRHFDPGVPGFEAADNPQSEVDGARMVRPDAIHLWTWDARPWPAFPALADVWADGLNWARGHWLNGRLGATTLGGLIGAVLADYGFTDFEVEGLDRVVSGAVIDRPMSVRAALEPLVDAFGVLVADRGDHLHFTAADALPVAAVAPEDCVDTDEGRGALVRWTRTQDSELPIEMRLGYRDAERDFSPAVAASRRLAGETRHVAEIDVAVLADAETMGRAADAALFARWAGRERVTFALPPSRLALQPGDVVTVSEGTASTTVVIEEIEDAGLRLVSARALDREIARRRGRGRGIGGSGRSGVRTAAPAQFGAPTALILDLPQIDASAPAERPYAAAFARPWPGGVVVERSRDGDGFETMATLRKPARIGTLVEPLGPGPEGAFDRGSRLIVRIAAGLQSRTPADVLAGANLAAIRSANGTFELVQFAEAELVGENIYALTMLLRAQQGTEDAMASGHPAGAPFVLVDGALAALAVARDEIGTTFLWRATPAGGDPNGPAAVTETLAPAGRGLKPLSPVHLAAARDPGSGDVTIRWIRRTRIGGDGWGEEEVPIGEERERYRCDILDGALLVRRIVTTEPAAVYGAAEQVADFGALPASLAVRVTQMAAGFGAGTPREALLHV